jgi:hypothetical protein
MNQNPPPELSREIGNEKTQILDPSCHARIMCVRFKKNSRYKNLLGVVNNHVETVIFV